MKVFNIYGHGGHLCHVNKTIFINVCSSFQGCSTLKFGFDRPSSFREQEDNGHAHVYIGYNPKVETDNPMGQICFQKHNSSVSLAILYL